ncbi:MAG TPA: hypothetical protein VMX55_11965 [candidate division Zixibacteria bacterium]|nr:hypothetical protein [candidate division Zixibacteria bacterium]
MRRKNTKSRFLLLLILISFSILGTITIYTKAHSPSSMTLSYITATETLEVTMTHSADLITHYINKVEIWKNDIITITETYDSQPSVTFTYNYVINVTTNDVLQVKASCNQGGSITKEITPIVGTLNSTNTTTNNTPGFALDIVIIGLTSVNVLGILIKKKNS